jgi:hypothetical protein
MQQPYRKKLIEVALPLEAINKAAAREESIRHGHPSTPHQGWARRSAAGCPDLLRIAVSHRGITSYGIRPFRLTLAEGIVIIKTKSVMKIFSPLDTPSGLGRGYFFPRGGA